MIAFQSKTSTIPFKKITEMAFRMHQNLKETVFTGNIQQVLPLPKGDYPVLPRYPEQVTITQIKLREKIISEEEEINKKAFLLEELRLKTEQVLANEERIRKQQEAAALAEIERRRKLQQE